MRNLVTVSGLALLVLLAGGCDSEKGEDVAAPAPRWNLPEVVYTEDGLPDPSILAPVQILHRGNGTQPQGLDPHITEGVPSTHVQRDLFESLVVRSPDGRIIPGAAERWEVSDDGLTWTFFLREDARWSNGEDLTAHDWLFSRLVEYGSAEQIYTAPEQDYTRQLLAAIPKGL